MTQKTHKFTGEEVVEILGTAAAKELGFDMTGNVRVETTTNSNPVDGITSIFVTLEIVE